MIDDEIAQFEREWNRVRSVPSAGIQELLFALFLGILIGLLLFAIAFTPGV